MIMDKTNLLSEAQAITVTARSTNIIDLGAPGTPVKGNALIRDIGKGIKIPFLLRVNTAFTTGDAASLAIAIQTDNDEAFGSPLTIMSVSGLLVASLVKGFVPPGFDYLPHNIKERYLSVLYTVTVGSFTGGKIDAAIVADTDQHMV